jgi:hypothetical protein
MNKRSSTGIDDVFPTHVFRPSPRTDKTHSDVVVDRHVEEDTVLRNAGNVLTDPFLVEEMKRVIFQEDDAFSGSVHVK